MLICSFVRAESNKSRVTPLMYLENKEPKKPYNPFKNSFLIQIGTGIGASSFWDTYTYYSFNAKIGNRWLLKDQSNNHQDENSDYKTKMAFQLTWLSISENRRLRYSYDEVSRTVSFLGAGLVSISQFSQLTSLEFGLNIYPRVKIMRLGNKLFGLKGAPEVRFGYKRFYVSADAGLSITLGLFGVSTGLAIGIYI